MKLEILEYQLRKDNYDDEIINEIITAIYS
jgi:hypothetical protein